MCKKLNSKNLFHAINKYEIFLLNYCVGLIEIKEKEAVELNLNIRTILRKYKTHI